MSKRSKSSKNGNKALQGLLGLIVLVGAVLGLTAFILHFTDKKNCSEGYCSGTGEPCGSGGAYCCTGLKCSSGRCY